MKNNADKIEQEVNRTLRLLNELPQLPVNPYFAADVDARLDELAAKSPGRLLTGISDLLKIAAVFLLIIMNVVTAWYVIDQDITEQKKDNSAAVVIAKDYGLDDPAIDILAQTN